MLWFGAHFIQVIQFLLCIRGRVLEGMFLYRLLHCFPCLSVRIFRLRALDTLGKYFTISTKGDNFSPSVCCIACQSPSKRESTYKVRICSLWEQILPYRVDSFLKGTKSVSVSLKVLTDTGLVWPYFPKTVHLITTLSKLSFQIFLAALSRYSEIS